MSALSASLLAASLLLPVSPREARTHDAAVVLVHGLDSSRESARAALPELQDWQRPGSPIVAALSLHADVFAFAYGQDVPVDDVARRGDLAGAVDALHEAGYVRITLAGHSAGGIVVRQFIEDHPDAPVTKVVQIATPNLGSGWGRASLLLSAGQLPFLESLTPEARRAARAARSERRIPAHVEFVCVLADANGRGDWIVPLDSQWPLELARQGVPAIRVRSSHGAVVSSNAAVAVAVAIVGSHPRGR